MTLEPTPCRDCPEGHDYPHSTRDCCPHLSWSGADRRPLDDPEKLWRCDECGVTTTEAAA